jgi:membrane dipeptidase
MLTVDMHCDTIMKIFENPQSNLRENAFQLDRAKLEAGDYLLQNFAIFMDKEAVDDSYQHAKAMMDCFDTQMAANSDWIRQVTTYDHVIDNERQGLISALLTMEEGAPIGTDLDRLEEFYHRGVRMMTLTWNYDNAIGAPNAKYALSGTAGLLSEQPQEGLTSFGIETVERMNELGMIIDVSHGSDQLVRDVLAHSKQPFVASHSNAREVRAHFRNLSDDLIRQIANRGGVIGMNYCDYFLREPGDDTPLPECVVKHIQHIRNVGGLEVIGLGSDFDGIDVHPDLADGASVMAILEALERAGFSTGEIEAIFRDNVLRLYREML